MTKRRIDSRQPRVGASKVRTENRCRACGRAPAAGPPRVTLTRHHLIPLNGAGEDVADNIIPLCYGCHRKLHSPAGNGQDRIRWTIKASLTDAEVAYVDRRMGRGWLDRHYRTETEYLIEQWQKERRPA